jgi:membrane-associated phospholipid phosphatase
MERVARVVAALCVLIALTTTAAAEPALSPSAPVPTRDQRGGPPLEWRWAKFSTLDYVLTLGGAGMTLAGSILKPRSEHSLTGGIWFDEDARDALRQDDAQSRYIFRDASDVGLSLAVTWPFFADSLVTAWWYRGSRDVAEQMALIDLQTLALVGAIHSTTTVLVSRERPFGRTCGSSEMPDAALDCEGSFHHRSFFSGHAAFSFTGAALICVHHMKQELLGPPWDALSCATGYAVAATTATFRMVADVHYASDVMTGALIGTLFGYGIPLLHYQTRPDSDQLGLKLQLVPAAGGLGVAGAF